MKYDYFKGLKGLRVKNIRVKQPNLIFGHLVEKLTQDLHHSSKGA